MNHCCILTTNTTLQINCESESRSDIFQPHRPYSPWNSPGQNTGVGGLSLLQGIFPTQGSNRGLLHCRRILYQLSYQGNLLQFTVHCYLLIVHLYTAQGYYIGSTHTYFLRRLYKKLRDTQRRRNFKK